MCKLQVCVEVQGLCPQAWCVGKIIDPRTFTSLRVEIKQIQRTFAHIIVSHEFCEWETIKHRILAGRLAEYLLQNVIVNPKIRNYLW